MIYVFRNNKKSWIRGKAYEAGAEKMCETLSWKDWKRITRREEEDLKENV